MPQILELMTEDNSDYYRSSYEHRSAPGVQSYAPEQDFIRSINRSNIYFSDYALCLLVPVKSGFAIKHPVTGELRHLPAELSRSLLAHADEIGKQKSLGELERSLSKELCNDLKSYYAEFVMSPEVKARILPYIVADGGVPSYLALLKGSVEGLLISSDRPVQKIIRQADGSYLYYRSEQLIVGPQNLGVSFATLTQSFVIKADGSLGPPLTLIEITKDPRVAAREADAREAASDAATMGASIGTPPAARPSLSDSPVVAGPVLSEVTESAGGIEDGFIIMWDGWVRSQAWSEGKSEADYPKGCLRRLAEAELPEKSRLARERAALAEELPAPPSEAFAPVVLPKPSKWQQWIATHKTRFYLRLSALVITVASLTLAAVIGIGYIQALPFLSEVVAAASMTVSPAILTGMLVVIAGLMMSAILLVISVHVDSQQSPSENVADFAPAHSGQGTQYAATPASPRRTPAGLRIATAGLATDVGSGSAASIYSRSEASSVRSLHIDTSSVSPSAASFTALPSTTAPPAPTARSAASEGEGETAVGNSDGDEEASATGSAGLGVET